LEYFWAFFTKRKEKRGRRKEEGEKRKGKGFHSNAGLL